MKSIKIKEKFNKGITLIALVITIIVLLILAGVSIAMLTGENGLLTQAEDAKKETESSGIEEEVKIAYAGIQPDAIIEGWDMNKKAEELQKELQKQDPSATVVADGTNLNVTYKGYELTISENGEVSDISQSKISIKVNVTGEEATVTADGSKIKEVVEGNVPIPVGFYYVGGTKNEGVVISDSSQDQQGKGTSHEQASNLEGNQFVWVPVKVNQNIEIEVTSNSNLSKVTINGEEQEVNGKTFTKTIENPRVNKRYSISVEDEGGNKKSYTKEVSTLYGQNMIMNAEQGIQQAGGYTYNTVEEALQGEGVSTLEELLSKAGVQNLVQYMVQEMKFIKEEIGQLDTMLETMYIEDPETQSLYESVNQYGGFYIARYEAGVPGTTESTIDNTGKTTIDGTIKPTSKKGVGVWNNIPYEDKGNGAKKVAESMYTGGAVQSKLLSGAAWDRTLQWLIETGDKDFKEIYMDSSSWGNYNDDTFEGTTNLIETGEYKETMANNIYDLAGNVEEWTTEAYTSGDQVNRGGIFADSGSDVPACIRVGTDPTDTISTLGFRPTLYL